MLESESPQRAGHEPVRILFYDPPWPQLFEERRLGLLNLHVAIKLPAMKRLALWCLLPFLSSVCLAQENQWDIGVQRAGVPLASFRPDRDFFVPVEYLRQKGPLCLSTAAAVALRYYGREVEPARIRELGKWDPVTGKRRDFDAGSTFDQIEDVLLRWDYHWSVRDYPPNQEGFREGMVEIHEQITLGHPVIVGLCLGGDGSHAVLVYGYDDLAQLVYILDSALPPPGKRLVTCDEFEKVWNFGAVGYPERTAMFTSPRGELPSIPQVVAVSPAAATPQPLPPSTPVVLPASFPSAEPEKTADHPPGGFRGHGSRSPSRTTSLPGAGQATGERGVPLKPFLP